MSYLNGQLTNIMSANDLAEAIAELQAKVTTLQGLVAALQTGKQDKLVAGTNIALIDGIDILDPEEFDEDGNIAIGSLSTNMTTTVTVGNLASGTTLEAGEHIENILEEILT